MTSAASVFADDCWVAASPPMRPADEVLLREAQLFRGATDADVDALLPSFRVSELRRREDLFVQGDPEPAHIYVVLTGRLVVTRTAVSGQSRTNVVGPGETIGLSILDPGPHASTATATRSTRVAALDRDAFLQWCTTRPHLAERLLRVLARRLRRNDDVALDLMFVDVGARLAKALLELSSRLAVRDPRGLLVEHGLSQQELAQLIGSSRESVNKLLRSFAERGYIQPLPGGVIIRDVAGLQTRASHP